PPLGEHTEGLVDLHAERRHRLIEPVLAWLKPRRNPRPALDLLHDPLGLELRPRPVPSLLVGAERDLLVAAVGPHLRAVADGFAVRPRALHDVALGWPGHQITLRLVSCCIDVARAVAGAGALGGRRDRWSGPHRRTRAATVLHP